MKWSTDAVFIVKEIGNTTFRKETILQNRHNQ